MPFLRRRQSIILAYILAESSNSKAVGKIRAYLSKWRPIRQALPGVAVELEALGMERGPKFDKVLEDFFQAQLLGRARKPEDHPKVLRKLAGIKEPPKKVEEKKKPEKPKKKGSTTPSPETPSPADTGKSKAVPAGQSAQAKIPGKANPNKKAAAKKK